MNLLRNFLIGGILVVTFLLVVEWNNFQERNANLPIQEQTSSEIPQINNEVPDPSVVPTVSTSENLNDVPVVQEGESSVSSGQPEVSSVASTNPITVSTDSLEIIIDPRGGEIVKVALPKHKAELNSDDPFVLLNKSNSRFYTAYLGLTAPKRDGEVINSPGTDNFGKPLYSSSKTSYSLTEGADTLTVDLELEQEEVKVIKRFHFSRNSYLINIEFIVNNNSSNVWRAYLYGNINRDNYAPPKPNAFSVASFTGYALTTEDTNYKKLPVDEVSESDKKLSETINNGWLAFVQHYFTSAWIPPRDVSVTYSIYPANNNLNIGNFLVNEAFTVNPGDTNKINSSFYAGPKDIRALQKLAPHLDKTVDYGFLWFIAEPLFFAMDNIHSHVGNWGIAIILITLAIKALFFWPSALSYRSMAKMRKVQPLMAELKERYGDDRQRMSQELMKLYKKEKVNPLSGCLPILLQMPVFIALYWMIMESVELRHSPFYLWIEDLSVKDPYFVLPLLMGVSMYIQQKLNPTPPDPMQAKVMQMLPIVFTFLFLFFPAGLVLYWVVNNTLSILQQYVITRQIEKSG